MRNPKHEQSVFADLRLLRDHACRIHSGDDTPPVMPFNAHAHADGIELHDSGLVAEFVRIDRSAALRREIFVSGAEADWKSVGHIIKGDAALFVALLFG